MTIIALLFLCFCVGSALMWWDKRRQYKRWERVESSWMEP